MRSRATTRCRSKSYFFGERNGRGPRGRDDSGVRSGTSSSAEDLGGNYPAIQYVPPTGDYSLDILARLGDAFRYEDLEAEEVLVDGIRIRVATPRMLYRMKKGTVRPRDRADAAEIKQHFGLEEEE